MRRTDLAEGMVVAAKDYDDRYERAEVRDLGSSESPLHMVVFQTGAYAGKSRGVASREIKCEWTDYQDDWHADRHEELRHEIELAQIAYDRESATDTLEAIRAALSTLEISGGIGQVVQRKPSGIMEQTMALFLPLSEAQKLLPVVLDYSERQLTT